MNKYLHLCSVFTENYKYPFFKIAGICANLAADKLFTTQDIYTEEDEDVLMCQEEVLKFINNKFEPVEEKFVKI